MFRIREAVIALLQKVVQELPKQVVFDLFDITLSKLTELPVGAFYFNTFLPIKLRLTPAQRLQQETLVTHQDCVRVVLLKNIYSCLRFFGTEVFERITNWEAVLELFTANANTSDPMSAWCTTEVLIQFAEIKLPILSEVIHTLYNSIMHEVAGLEGLIDGSGMTSMDSKLEPRFYEIVSRIEMLCHVLGKTIYRFRNLVFELKTDVISIIFDSVMHMVEDGGGVLVAGIDTSNHSLWELVKMHRNYFGWIILNKMLSLNSSWLRTRLLRIIEAWNVVLKKAQSGEPNMFHIIFKLQTQIVTCIHSYLGLCKRLQNQNILEHISSLLQQTFTSYEKSLENPSQEKYAELMNSQVCLFRTHLYACLTHLSTGGYSIGINGLFQRGFEDILLYLTNIVKIPTTLMDDVEMTLLRRMYDETKDFELVVKDKVLSIDLVNVEAENMAFSLDSCTNLMKHCTTKSLRRLMVYAQIDFVGAAFFSKSFSLKNRVKTIDYILSCLQETLDSVKEPFIKELKTLPYLLTILSIVNRKKGLFEEKKYKKRPSIISTSTPRNEPRFKESPDASSLDIGPWAKEEKAKGETSDSNVDDNEFPEALTVRLLEVALQCLNLTNYQARLLVSILIGKLFGILSIHKVEEYAAYLLDRMNDPLSTPTIVCTTGFVLKYCSAKKAEKIRIPMLNIIQKGAKIRDINSRRFFFIGINVCFQTHGKHFSKFLEACLPFILVYYMEISNTDRMVHWATSEMMLHLTDAVQQHSCPGNNYQYGFHLKIILFDLFWTFFVSSSPLTTLSKFKIIRSLSLIGRPLGRIRSVKNLHLTYYRILNSQLTYLYYCPFILESLLSCLPLLLDDLESMDPQDPLNLNSILINMYNEINFLEMNNASILRNIKDCYMELLVKQINLRLITIEEFFTFYRQILDLDNKSGPESKVSAGSLSVQDEKNGEGGEEPRQGREFSTKKQVLPATRTFINENVFLFLKRLELDQLKCRELTEFSNLAIRYSFQMASSINDEDRYYGVRLLTLLVTRLRKFNEDGFAVGKNTEGSLTKRLPSTFSPQIEATIKSSLRNENSDRQKTYKHSLELSYQLFKMSYFHQEAQVKKLTVFLLKTMENDIKDSVGTFRRAHFDQVITFSRIITTLRKLEGAPSASEVNGEQQIDSKLLSYFDRGQLLALFQNILAFLHDDLILWNFSKMFKEQVTESLILSFFKSPNSTALVTLSNISYLVNAFVALSNGVCSEANKESFLKGDATSSISCLIRRNDKHLAWKEMDHGSIAISEMLTVLFKNRTAQKVLVGSMDDPALIHDVINELKGLPVYLNALGELLSLKVPIPKCSSFILYTFCLVLVKALPSKGTKQHKKKLLSKLAEHKFNEMDSNDVPRLVLGLLIEEISQNEVESVDLIHSTIKFIQRNQNAFRGAPDPKGEGYKYSEDYIKYTSELGWRVAKQFLVRDSPILRAPNVEQSINSWLSLLDEFISAIPFPKPICEYLAEGIVRLPALGLFETVTLLLWTLKHKVFCPKHLAILPKIPSASLLFPRVKMVLSSHAKVNEELLEIVGILEAKLLVLALGHKDEVASLLCIKSIESLFELGHAVPRLLHAFIPLYCNFLPVFDLGPVISKEINLSVGRLISRVKSIEELASLEVACSEKGKEVLSIEGAVRRKELEDFREMEKKKENTGIKLKKFGRK